MMQNTLFIFRFQDTNPNNADKYLLNKHAKGGVKSCKFKSTPFGFITIIQTTLDVKSLKRIYQRKEKKNGISLPIMILNLSSERVEGQGTHFRMRDVSENCIRRNRKIKVKSIASINMQEKEPSVDEILEKIFENGIGAITANEREILDSRSFELRKLKKQIK